MSVERYDDFEFDPSELGGLSIVENAKINLIEVIESKAKSLKESIILREAGEIPALEVNLADLFDAYIQLKNIENQQLSDEEVSDKLSEILSNIHSMTVDVNSEKDLILKKDEDDDENEESNNNQSGFNSNDDLDW